jgi:hypothetical protein
VKVRVALILGLIFLLSVAAALMLAFRFIGSMRSCELDHLLAGDDGNDVVSLTIEGQGQQKINIDDPAAMRYLTEAFRNSPKDNYNRNLQQGLTYYAYMNFSNGNSVRVAVNTPDNVQGLTIDYPLDDPILYWIPFADPIPEPVANALRYMRNRPAKR